MIDAYISLSCQPFEIQTYGRMQGFIKEHKEARHMKVMEWQKEKFENLWCRKTT